MKFELSLHIAARQCKPWNILQQNISNSNHHKSKNTG